jgi:hypothetical protein
MARALAQAEYNLATAHLHTLLPFVIIFIGVCWARKRNEFGGWLLYFYGWMFLMFYSYLREFVNHLGLYLPTAQVDKVQRLALVATVIPRLLATVAVLMAMVILVIKRDMVWLQRLKVTLGAAVIIAGVSVYLDTRFFPTVSPANLRRLVMLIVWFVYLNVSRRVHQVFITKDWVEPTNKPETKAFPLSSS